MGLIGGSIALAVREVWPSAMVVAVDRHDVVDSAMRQRAIDRGAADLSVLAGADLIVLAAPVRQNLQLLGQLEGAIPGPAIVTDTGSTKRAIVAAAEALPARFTFVGGHPLGGAAVGGLEHARADLFRTRPWIFTPASTAPDDAVGRLTAFAAALGADTTVMSAADHDRVLAFLSHLPQLAASALMTVVGNSVGNAGLALAGRGLVDTTRLSSSPADIWRDIAASNADEIGPALDLLIATLQSLRRDLPAGDALTDVFTAAARWRQQLTSRSTL
ncbi:MAG TPA: prephenate dehydrogenase/arogenate dehydrogenase family protein [Vicinamibacterales bacterium]|nr:prephenate dehydrogenase/arogenate dehydrogenase family protein [Vicinamibacterales bacterium]